VAAHLAPGSELVGDATREILDVGERVGAELVVMGRPDGGTLRRAVLGSAVDGVLRAARCPVFVVPERASPAERVVQEFDRPLPDAAARNEMNSDAFSVVGSAAGRAGAAEGVERAPTWSCFAVPPTGPTTSSAVNDPATRSAANRVMRRAP